MRFPSRFRHNLELIPEQEFDLQGYRQGALVLHHDPLGGILIIKNSPTEPPCARVNPYIERVVRQVISNTHMKASALTVLSEMLSKESAEASWCEFGIRVFDEKNYDHVVTADVIFITSEILRFGIAMSQSNGDVCFHITTSPIVGYFMRGDTAYYVQSYAPPQKDAKFTNRVTVGRRLRIGRFTGKELEFGRQLRSALLGIFEEASQNDQGVLYQRVEES